MTSDHRPHTTPDDARLAKLLSDAVADVEPHDALGAIRARTKEAPPMRTRSWLYAAGGAAAAVAATVAAFTVLGDTDPDATGADPAASATPTQTGDPSPSATDTPSPTEPAGPARTVAVYYVGDAGPGPRLFREFAKVPGATVLEAAMTGLATEPQDPDYRTWWAGQGIARATYDGEIVSIVLTDGFDTARPADMSAAEASMAVEQAIYTAQAAVQERAPVQFRLAANPVNEVFGVPTSEPLANGPLLETLNHVSLTTPVEGQTAGGSLEVSGVANSFEANVVVTLTDADGDEVVPATPFTAEGYMGPRLFPFEGTLDLSGVAPGSYLLTASTDDPSGGEEGFGPFTDTRTVVVE